MQENSVVDHETINHFETPVPNIEILQLVSSHFPVQYESRHSAVWSYVYPGRNISAAYFHMLIPYCHYRYFGDNYRLRSV